MNRVLLSVRGRKSGEILGRILSTASTGRRFPLSDTREEA